jgi:hypothetical protein
VLHLKEIPPVPEKISKRKIIVYKSRVDPTIVKLTAEKMKYKLFGKFGFSKRKSEEIHVVSVDKYYEPYILIDARYNIRYFKKKVYSFGVDPETEEVKIMGTSYTPETKAGASGDAAEPSKVINLEAELWSSYDDKVYLVLDKEGKEIPPDQVPAAPSEENPEKILKEFSKNAGMVQLSPRKEIDMVKARLVKRPSDIAEIEDELFNISEHAVIYSPLYEITFRNVRTGEERVVKIDGVSAKIIS